MSAPSPRFLAPTARKLRTALGLATLLPGLFLLRQVPARVDVLDLRQLAELLLGALLGLPIRFLDLVTDSAFAPRSEGFLAFPSLPQVAFALGVDALLFWLAACTWVRWRESRT